MAPVPKSSVIQFRRGTTAKRNSMLACSVLVMTVQILENRLNNGTLTFQDFHMLILDEGHHTRGDSPYAKVMGLYRCQPEETRVAVKVSEYCTGMHPISTL